MCAVFLIFVDSSVPRSRNYCKQGATLSFVHIEGIEPPPAAMYQQIHPLTQEMLIWASSHSVAAVTLYVNVCRPCGIRTHDPQFVRLVL